jgi:invasion protein IalB
LAALGPLTTPTYPVYAPADPKSIGTGSIVGKSITGKSIGTGSMARGQTQPLLSWIGRENNSFKSPYPMLKTLTGLAQILVVLATIAAPPQISAQEHNPSSGVAQEAKVFADWQAACQPETGYCVASALVNPNPASGAVADYVLQLARQEKGIYWEVSLTTIFDLPAIDTPVTVQIDSTTLALTPYRDLAAFGAPNNFYLLGDAAQFVLDKMVPGKRIAFSYANEFNQPTSIRFSLNGLGAALVWIDEQQRRLGAERVARDAPIGLGDPLTTRTAFARLPGPLSTLHRAYADCDPPEDLPNANEIGIYALTGTSTLYMLPCTAGAYNFSYRLYIENEFELTPLLFAYYSERFGWRGAEVLVNPEFDPETGTLTSFYKGRGPADCGTRGTWVWDEYAFKMIRYRTKDLCDFTGEPGQFPQVYP